jgi:alpha-tubulin suppressor-like RCC1 family protein
MSYIYYSVGGKLAVSNGKALRTLVYPLLSGRVNGVQLLKADGRMWGWGYGTNGEIGNNSATAYSTPVSVCGTVKTFCRIGAGSYASYGVDFRGKVWGWGYGGVGELGNNNTLPFSTPVSVAGALKTFCQISGGYIFALALDQRGKGWGWGYGFQGQLGRNNAAQYSTPISICGANKTFCIIDAGSSHGVALDLRGRAWAWGSNFNGCLGDNSTNTRLTPISVCGAVQTFCKIFASENNTYAINKDGRLFSWGDNTNGALGDNTITQRITPVRVGGAVKTFCQIAVGSLYAAAIDRYGKIWSWGNNNFGQLGNNSTTGYSTPVSVCGANKTFCRIYGGSATLYGVDKNGNVWAWGSNTSGEIGDNSLTHRSTPVRVCGL